MGKHQVAYQKRVRVRVVELLGGICKQCGFTDPRALQVDHVKSNGRKERLKYSPYQLYKRVLKVRGVGYQLLCANCNWIKRHTHSECPGAGGKTKKSKAAYAKVLAKRASRLTRASLIQKIWGNKRAMYPMGIRTERTILAPLRSQ